MSQVQVKWVDGYYDTPEDVPKRKIGNIGIVPTSVVPLAALRKWLKRLDDDMRAAGFDAPTEAKRLLASLDAEGVQ